MHDSNRVCVLHLDPCCCCYCCCSWCCRFLYSAFLTVICLLCPAIIIWLDPWTWGLWRPEMMFLVSGGSPTGMID